MDRQQALLKIAYLAKLLHTSYPSTADRLRQHEAALRAIRSVDDEETRRQWEAEEAYRVLPRFEPHA